MKLYLYICILGMLTSPVLAQRLRIDDITIGIGLEKLWTNHVELKYPRGYGFFLNLPGRGVQLQLNYLKYKSRRLSNYRNNPLASIEIVDAPDHYINGSILEVFMLIPVQRKHSLRTYVGIGVSSNKIWGGHQSLIGEKVIEFEEAFHYGPGGMLVLEIERIGNTPFQLWFNFRGRFLRGENSALAASGQSYASTIKMFGGQIGLSYVFKLRK